MNFGEPVNSIYLDGEPSLVADGSIMYFVHVLVDDEGVFGSDGEARNKPEMTTSFTIK